MKLTALIPLIESLINDLNKSYPTDDKIQLTSVHHVPLADNSETLNITYENLRPAIFNHATELNTLLTSLGYKCIANPAENLICVYTNEQNGSITYAITDYCLIINAIYYEY